MSRSWRWLTPALLLGAAVLALAWPLPQPLLAPPYARALLDRDGHLLAATIAADGQWRFAPLVEVPERFATALVTFEDQRFFVHPGIDPLALARALRDNLSQRRVVSGASTLTMQLARQVHGQRPRTLTNKIIEAWLALRLELRYSKAELLALYASHAPFGGNVVGLNAAAWRYYDRPPQQLSWAEAATLAVLPNSPALIHPGRRRDALAARRDALLQTLHQRGVLTDLDLAVALAEPLPQAPQPLPRWGEHLLFTLQQQQPQPLYHSTLALPLQRRISQLAAEHGGRLMGEGIQDLAVLVVDHQLGEVVAYVGNHDGADRQRAGGMLDVIQRPRSNGSLLKPLLYGLMLDQGELLPGQLVADVPTHFAGYSPMNYDRDFRGAVRANEALARSLNVPFVRLLRQHGVEPFHRRLRELGLTDLFRPAGEYGLALILGGSESTLWDLVTVYSQLMVAARDGEQGDYRRPRLLQDEVPSPLPARLSQGAAWLTLEALLEVVRPGDDMRWRRFSSSQPIAWKTGTSFGLRDAWAIGSNGRYTVGVWAGNAEGQGVATLAGTATAGPVMLDVFAALGRAAWPARPTAALMAVEVCRDDGFLPDGLCERSTDWAPRGSHYQQVSPHHVRVHRDAAGARVHAGCENPLNMITEAYFQLPPVQEHYWRRQHSGRRIPAWRADCLAELAEYTDEQPMALVYPQDGTRVLLPVELDGRLGAVLFRAVHRDPQARLQWHLDRRYQGETRVFHDMALRLEPGWHRIRLVDQHGRAVEQWVKALARERTPQAAIETRVPQLGGQDAGGGPAAR